MSSRPFAQVFNTSRDEDFIISLGKGANFEWMDTMNWKSAFSYPGCFPILTFAMSELPTSSLTHMLWFELEFEFELLLLLSVFLILMGKNQHCGLVKHPVFVFSKSLCTKAGSAPPGSPVITPRSPVAVAPLAPAPTPAVVTVIGVGPALKGGEK